MEKMGRWWRENWEVVAVLFLFIANFYLSLGLTPLFDLDEGAFSEATREMLLNHNFITTYLNGHLRFDKPILIYWLQALSVFLFGEHSWAFRLPSAIATTIWGGVIYWFTRRLYSPRAALYALLVFSTALQIGIIGKAAIADALLNMWLAVTLLSLYLYISTRRERWLLIAFAAAGFGFLTKGPVAVVVPIVPYFIYSLLNREIGHFFKSVFNWKGILLFTVIALPWYLAEYLQQGQKFIDGFFLKHNLKRFETPLESHSGSIFYYLPVVVIGLLPWTTLLFSYLWNWKRWKGEKFGLFSLLVFGWVFLLFSLSGTKLPHYIIYGYTPLFVVMGKILEEYRSRLKLITPMALFLGFLLILPFMARSLLPVIKDQFAKVAIITLLPYFDRFYFWAVLGLLIALLYPFSLRTTRILLGLSGVVVVNYLLWIYAHFIQFPVYGAAQYVRHHQIDKIVMWRLNTPSFILYSHRFVEKRDPKIGDIVLTRVTEIGKLPGYKPLYLKGGIALVKVTPPVSHSNPFNYRKDRRE